MLHRFTETANDGLGSSIEKINVAGRSNDSMNPQGVASDENKINGALVQADNEVKKVRRQRIVVFASSALAQRPGRPFDLAVAGRRPAEAMRYACFDTCATEASRFDFDCSGLGSAPSSCRRIWRPDQVWRRRAARAARSNAAVDALRIAAVVPSGVLAITEIPTMPISFSADSKLTFGRWPLSSSATNRTLTPPRFASSARLILS